jgi:hypothetical protein
MTQPTRRQPPPRRLTAERYFELIDKDTDRLIAMGERGLEQAVPHLTDWNVAEVLWHVAGVYEHKVRVMADNAWPQDWPPEEFQDKEEIGFLRDAKTHLFEEFSRHEIDEQTQTFGDDTTIGFWARRMACEIAIHRYDAEVAHDATTPIDDDIAVDGIDEMLGVMLGGDWWKERVRTEHPVDALVGVDSGGHRWVCDVQRTVVTVSDDPTTPAKVTVSGEPAPVFRWMWGRASDTDVAFAGDEATAHEFRARLAECGG